MNVKFDLVRSLLPKYEYGLAAQEEKGLLTRKCEMVIDAAIRWAQEPGKPRR